MRLAPRRRNRTQALARNHETRAKKILERSAIEKAMRSVGLPASLPSNNEARPPSETDSTTGLRACEQATASYFSNTIFFCWTIPSAVKR